MKKEREPGLVQFMERVGVVTRSALAVLTLAGIIAGGLTWWSGIGGRQEARARAEADTLLIRSHRDLVQAVKQSDKRIDRLADIVELAVVSMVETPGSAEQLGALRNLRRMRRVTAPEAK